MPRRPSYNLAYTFGPGPLSSAIKTLIYVNVGAFIVSLVWRPIIVLFGLVPAAVVEEFRVWQVVTYMFLHGGLFHILFNMLALWMFGTELERAWGTRFFLRYYFVTGIGAGLLTIALGFLPFDFATRIYYSVTIGASGAIFGLLLAYGLLFPDRPIYVYAIFPIPARYFVIIFGAIALFSSITDTGGGTAHITHVAGLAVGYVYLKGRRLFFVNGRRLSPWADVKYRYIKWRMNRLRKKFDVYSGGRSDDWDKRIH
jgi:membrane associated rhomboid family serine protease